MSLLSQQAVADAITAVVQASGTAPNNQTGLEEAIVSVRNRIRTAGRVETLQQQKAALSRVLVPLITWLETEPLLTDLDSNTKSDLLWNIYTAGVSRTQAAEAFPLVRSDENQWNDLVRSLTPPAADSTQPLGQENEMEGTLHWKLLVTSLACLAMDAWIPSDRVRFYTTLLGTVLLAVGLACWFRGWTKGPFSKSKPDASRNQAASRTRSMNLSDELPPLEPLVPDQPQLSSVPSGVPPIPTVDQQLGLEASPSASGLTVGTSITLLAIPPYTGLAGQKGIVMACEKGGYSVSLSSGLTLQNVPQVAWDVKQISKRVERLSRRRHRPSLLPCGVRSVGRHDRRTDKASGAGWAAEGGGDEGPSAGQHHTSVGCYVLASGQK